MRSKFGGLSPSEETWSAMNSASSEICRARLWARSKPIVEEVLRSSPEPPQSEPPRCPGQTSTSSGEFQQPPVQRAEHVGGALARFDRQVGAGDVADEERVAGKQRPGRPAAAGSLSRKQVCSGRCPGVWIASTVQVAELQLPAVGERLMRVLGLGQLVDVDDGAGAAASRPWPETWSAWLWVSSTCPMRTPCSRASRR